MSKFKVCCCVNRCSKCVQPDSDFPVTVDGIATGRVRLNGYFSVSRLVDCGTMKCQICGDPLGEEYIMFYKATDYGYAPTNSCLKCHEASL